MRPVGFAAVIPVACACAAALGQSALQLDSRSAVYEVKRCKALHLREEVTLEAWVMPARLPRGGGRIIDKSVPGTNDGYVLDTYPGNSLRLITSKGHCRFDARLPTDAWTHVVGVYSAPRRIMKLYVNGAEVASLAAGPFPPIARARVPLRIGADPKDGNRFIGRIRRVAVYARALSASEVAARARSALRLEGVLGDWALPQDPGKRILPENGRLILTRSGAESYEGQAPPPDQPLSLWYRQPAAKWVHALPIGNGRLGAMVLGGVEQERIQLNEDTLWAGGPRDETNPEALEALPIVRRLLVEGKPREAVKLADAKMLARGRTVPPYQTLGDLWLDFEDVGEIRDYRRDLDVDSAVARMTYLADGARLVREVFATAPDQSVVVRLTCARPGSISFSATMTRSRNARAEAAEADSTDLALRGRCDGGKGLSFVARLRAIPEGGGVRLEGDRLLVKSADAVTLLVTAATSYRGRDPEAECRGQIEAASRKGYRALRDAHVADHRLLFRRVELELRAGGQPEDRTLLPTDERLARVKAGGRDPGLVALYFQFGRYLLISSSRRGTMPANLQGVWNESLRPPWRSDFHLNINIQMNYWPAEVTNLAECHLPLFDLLESLREPGRRTAREHYGCGGFVAHHISDIWGFTSPGDGARWGLWPMGAAWLCDHLWEHYLFGRDRTFLSSRAYPVMKEAAAFFLDYLVQDVKGRLVTGPSISPENSYRLPSGSTGVLCMGPSMDSQIVRELFSHCIEASALLGVDAAFRQRLVAA